MLTPVLNKIESAIKNKSEQAFSKFMEDLHKIPYSQKQLKGHEKKMSLMEEKNRNKNKKNSPPRILQEKKTKLLKQLTTIEHELVKCHTEKQKMKKKTQSNEEEEKAFNRASDLIARMNQQRKEKSQSKRKQSEMMKKNIKRTLQVFAEMNEETEKQKEEKRLLIEQRILQRKKKLSMRAQYNKKADQLITQLQSYRVSLPAINHLNPEESKGGQASSSSLKRHNRSSFLNKIHEEQLKKKREEYIKMYEKSKIRERQQLYGRKVRKSLKESSVFVTN